MSQAIKKKLVSLLSNISNLVFDAPQMSLYYRLNKLSLATLCCHLKYGCGETKSPCKSYEGKKSSKKGKD